jgi:hypothetical protein
MIVIDEIAARNKVIDALQESGALGVKTRPDNG